jgi:hypothetical protein
MASFESEQRLIQDGQPVQALRVLAGKIADDPANRDAFQTASTALFAALNHPETLANWARPEKDACYRALLLQSACPARPLILAHDAASTITSGTPDAANRLVQELASVLHSLLADETLSPSAFKNVAVFLLTTRACPSGGLDQAELSRLHLSWFERFTPDDFALPYSVMFNPDYFGQNRDDLLTHYWGAQDRITGNSALGPAHLLFFEWLAGRDYFSAPDNADLDRFLTAHLPGSAQDRAAARMLVIRHWRKDGALSKDKLAAFGMEDIATLAQSAAQARQGYPKVQSQRPGAKLLHKTPYQALQAGWQRTAATLPYLNRSQRRVKIAICLSGQLRGYKAAYAQWQKTLLPNVDAHFFVHSWRRTGRSDAQPFRHVLPFAGTHFSQAYRKIAVAKGYDAMRNRYPALFTALATGAQAHEDDLKALYDTDHVVLEDDTAKQFAGFSNQQKMHYKIHAANEMARQIGDFDLHIRLRPDLDIKLIGFDWRDLLGACQSRSVLFAEKPYGLHYGRLMIGDQCAIAAPEVMASYAGTWETFPTLAAARLATCPNDFIGHVSLALSSWTHGVQIEKAPIKFGQLQEAQPLPSQEILTTLEQDGRDDADDRHLISAVHKDL